MTKHTTTKAHHIMAILSLSHIFDITRRRSNLTYDLFYKVTPTLSSLHILSSATIYVSTRSIYRHLTHIYIYCRRDEMFTLHILLLATIYCPFRQYIVITCHRLPRILSTQFVKPFKSIFG